MRYKSLGALFLCFCCFAAKKNKDDFTQIHDLPKDLPSVAVGDSRRLTFQVSPLSAKGLLSQQVRDAIKAILRDNGNAPVVHIRAFVAGSGDIRRVPQIVSDVFSEKHAALPAVSVVLTGALPLEGAQVVLEAVSLAKKDVNPTGVDFVAADPEVDNDPQAPAAALLAKELTQLGSRLKGAQPIRVTCFVSEFSGAGAVAAKFPGAIVNLVQPQRLSVRGYAQCEAVVRGVRTGTGTLAFTGTRVAFGGEEKDALLAWQRLDRDLSEAGAQPSGIAYTHVYRLSPAVAEMALKLRPASGPIATIPVEGLASVDAGFAVDAVAMLNK